MSLSHPRMTARARLSIQLSIRDRWFYWYRHLQFHFKFSCSSNVTFRTFLAFIFFFPYHDNIWCSGLYNFVCINIENPLYHLFSTTRLRFGDEKKICFIQVDLNLIDSDQCILFVEKETWTTIWCPGQLKSIMTVSVVHPHGTQDGLERGLTGTTEGSSTSSVETLGSLLILVEVEDWGFISWRKNTSYFADLKERSLCHALNWRREAYLIINFWRSKNNAYNTV